MFKIILYILAIFATFYFYLTNPAFSAVVDSVINCIANVFFFIISVIVNITEAFIKFVH